MQIENWPFFEELLSLKIFDPLDLFFAKKFLGLKNEEDGCLAASILKISQQNDFCLNADPKNWYIPLDFLFKDIAEAKKKSLQQRLIELVIKGAASISFETVQRVNSKNSFFPSTPICRLDNFFFLQRNWVFKMQIAGNLKRLLTSPAISFYDFNLFIFALNNLLKEKKLLEAQKEGIEKIINKNMLVISGGPGTGKSYMAAFVIDALLKSLPEDKKENIKVVITALSGKAVSKLALSISKQIKLFFSSCTLHSLLNLKETAQRNFLDKKIDADILIIDEASMIDIRLMSYLLESISSDTKVILMGDIDQLSPIEGGNVFKEIIALLPQENTVVLKQNVRFEKKTIADFSQLIMDKKIIEIFNFFDKGKINFFEIVDDYLAAKTAIVDQALNNYFISQIEKPDPIRSLAVLGKFCILSCVRKGILGIEEINQAILNALLQKEQGWSIIPILITKNNYRLNLFNGMIGVQIFQNCSDTKSLEATTVFFAEDTIIRQIPLVAISHFEYGFCLSVHKAQGSEFEKVILSLPPSSEIFGKELLYTAVTRTKNELQIFSKRKTIEEMINKEIKNPPNFLKLGGF